jgi:single-strand DNA-binding protein
MASFNKITIVGYLGRDPELRYTPQGTAVCSFSVATTEKRKDKAGEMQENTTWFRITAWGRQAEVANQYLAKGKQVYIEGRLRQEEYTDREGKVRTSLEVFASDLHFLGSRGDEPTGASGGAAARSSASAASPEAEITGPAVSDDDIPF